MIKKILSVLFITFFIGLSPVQSVFAEDSSVASPSADVQNSQTDEVVMSDELDQQQAPIAIIENNNSATISANVHLDSDTGGNTTEDTVVGAETEIGDASASASLHTDVNKNITGFIDTDTINLDDQTAGDIVLANAGNTCSGAQGQSISVSNNNVAHVINNIEVNANSGGNKANGVVASIQTGDATASAHLSTIVNTNLTGDCGYMGIVNVYEEHNGNIVLPNDQAYVPQNSDTAHADDKDTGVINENKATVSGEVHAAATTGTNTARVIDTGNGTVTVRQVDVVNTNITGDNWLMVRVNNASLWQGMFVGWDGNVYRGADYALAWSKVPSGYSIYGSVSNTNRATIENNVNVRANTGNNSANGIVSTIQTGSASAQVGIFNMINTNITGSRWMYVLVNLFDQLNGNIIFPRPNLTLTLVADRSNVHPGDESVVTAAYTNKGILSAADSRLEVAIPDGVDVTAAAEGFGIQGNILSWDMGTLVPGQSGSKWLRVRLSRTAVPSSINLTAVLKTSGSDIDRTDNTSSVTFTLSNETLEVTKSIPTDSEDDAYQTINDEVEGIKTVHIKHSTTGEIFGASNIRKYEYAKISTMYEGNAPKVKFILVFMPAAGGAVFLFILKKYARAILFE